MYNFNNGSGVDHSKPKDIQPRKGRGAEKDSGSTIHLLTLPSEVRCRIFELVLQAGIDTPFPPQERTGTVENIRSWLSGSTKAPCGRCCVTGPDNGPQPRNKFVDMPLVCRQIYHEVRNLAFELNTVRLLAPYGSNVSATMNFLGRLSQGQRDAVRDLEVHLAASPTEGWWLRNILKSVGGVDGNGGASPGCDETDGGVQYSCFPYKQGLRSLKLHIKTNDLLLPGAESISGLMHFLARGTRLDYVGLNQSWMEDGLVHLKCLENVDIEMKMSTGVASKILSSHKSSFEQRVRSIAPRMCDVQVRWHSQEGIGRELDAYRWTDFLWMNSCMPADVKA